MWAPHSTSPQSSSTIFFRRFLEILLWWTNEFRKLGEFKLLHIPLSSRINTPNYALYFPCPSRGRSLQSLRCDINVHYWVVWGDALGLYRHFCKSLGSSEELSEWREKASPPGAELSCVPHTLFSHPEVFYQHCFALTCSLHFAEHSLLHRGGLIPLDSPQVAYGPPSAQREYFTWGETAADGLG